MTVYGLTAFLPSLHKSNTHSLTLSFVLTFGTVNSCFVCVLIGDQRQQNSYQVPNRFQQQHQHQQQNRYQKQGGNYHNRYQGSCTAQISYWTLNSDVSKSAWRMLVLAMCTSLRCSTVVRVVDAVPFWFMFCRQWTASRINYHEYIGSMSFAL